MRTHVQISVIAIAISAIQSCSNSGQPPSAKTEDSSMHTESATVSGVDSVSGDSASADFIEIDSFRFKLSPDVQKDGVAHLDFYVRDKVNNGHVKGVTGNFVITKPDGSKIEIPIEEETPHDHYHGMIKLDQPGEYLVVGQVAIEGKKLNPRFSFSRKTQ